MALHKQAAQALAASFAAHQTRKEYRALVRGWLPETLEVDHPLKPDDAPEDAPVQEAHTRLRCLARLSWPESWDGRHPETRISLVEALPTTGRRHQIRRHLKHVAHPIIGDATHGKGPLNRWWAERLGQQRLWLHARALEIAHPVSGQPLRFEADWSALPQVQEAQDWQKLLALPGWQPRP
jgi:tRNA pseudouridine65 synthase